MSWEAAKDARIRELEKAIDGHVEKAIKMQGEINRLRAALKAAVTSLEMTRWHPEGNLDRWAASAEGMNHGRVMDAILSARAALSGDKP